MKKNNKICFVANHAAHYRKEIFLLINRELNCNFYFGNIAEGSIKKIDYKLFSFCKELKTTKLFGNWYWINSLSLLLKYDKFIFTGDFYCLSGWIMLILAKILNKKTYSWGHAWYGRETKIKKTIKRLYFGLCTSSFVYGNYARDLMIKEGFNPFKLHVVYNSLPYSEQLVYRNNSKHTDIYKEYFSNSNKNIFFVGRLIESKKINELLMAFSLLQKQRMFYNLTLIGTGPDLKNIKKKAQQLKLESIWYYGECYEEEKLSELIFNADLCVSPGEVGLTAIHSLMYGTPLITHNYFPRQGPEFEAVIDGFNGCFFKENDECDLANKISSWINGKDRDKIRSRCYKIIDEFYNPYFQIGVIKDVLQISSRS